MRYADAWLILALFMLGPHALLPVAVVYVAMRVST